MTRRDRTPRARLRAVHARGARLSREGRYGDAQAALRKAVAIGERAFGAGDAELVGPLIDLARSCRCLARFVDAGLLYQRALRIAERVHGSDHPDVAAIYHDLGALEHAARNWMRGEPFARKAARLRARALGPRHPLVAADLTSLGALLDAQGRHVEAEPLHRRALSILDGADTHDPEVRAAVLSNLAAACASRRPPAEAEALSRRALEVRTAAVGPGHPTVGLEWARLAALTGRRSPADAVPLFRRALRILRRTLGARHPHVGVCLEHYAGVLRRLRRIDAARASARTAARIAARIDSVNAHGVALTGTIDPDHARFDLVVRRSPIHRLGVFAGERIPAHRKVIEYTGERISTAEAARRWDPARSYLFDLNRRWQIDGAIGGSGAEYINHSCEPNLKGRLVQGHILYFSAREIAEGEELTVDYQYAHDTDRMPCTCGAARCRGVMNLSRKEARARRARRRR